MVPSSSSQCLTLNSDFRMLIRTKKVFNKIIELNYFSLGCPILGWHVLIFNKILPYSPLYRAQEGTRAHMLKLEREKRGFPCSNAYG